MKLSERQVRRLAAAVVVALTTAITVGLATGDVEKVILVLVALAGTYFELPQKPEGD